MENEQNRPSMEERQSIQSSLSKKEIKFRMKCEESYGIISEKLGLNNKMTRNEQVQEMIYHGDKLMSEICYNADLIKIDYCEQAQGLMPIEKAQWMEFVGLAVKSTNGTITDKLIISLEESFENSIFVTSQRMKFVETFVKSHGSTKVELPEREQDIPLPSLEDFKSDDEFELLIQKAVNTRNYLDQVLWPQYRELSEAFQYLCKFEFEHYHFKELVDMWHYRFGGYPSENTPPKLWSKLNTFSKIVTLMREFQLPQIEHELKRFGIDVEINVSETNKRIMNNFSDVVYAFMDSELYEIRPSQYEEISLKYPDLQLDSYILIHNGKQIAFAQDTREIYEIPMLNASPIDLYHLTEIESDSYMPLFLSNNCSDSFKEFIVSNFKSFLQENTDSEGSDEPDYYSEM